MKSEADQDQGPWGAEVSGRLDSDVLDAVRNRPEGCALPARCYLDPSIFELEARRLLLPGWHAVARVDELGEPGDYRAVWICGTRLLLVRDEARRLRAFSGTCLHRAFPIASDCGNARRLVCPYHRWAYDLDGRLRAAPLMEEVDGFARDALRLPELPLVEWQGFVLVSADPGAEPITPSLAPLDELLGPCQLHRFIEVDVLDFDSPFNWKVLVENFMESYHHLGVHLDSLQRTNPAEGTHALDLEGPFAVLENPGVDGAPPFWVFQVFPSMLFAISRGDAPSLAWYEMQIDRVDHLHLRIHLLLPEELATDLDVVAWFRKFITDVHLEDIPVCLGIQRGLASPLWQPGRLSRQERPLEIFHRYWSGRLLGEASERQTRDPSGKPV